jgi:hypothetical protein
MTLLAYEDEFLIEEPDDRAAPPHIAPEIYPSHKSDFSVDECGWGVVLDNHVAKVSVPVCLPQESIRLIDQGPQYAEIVFALYVAGYNDSVAMCGSLDESQLEALRERAVRVYSRVVIPL